MRKARGSGNAEGAGKRKCGRRGKAEMRKAECDRIVGRWMNGRGVTERRTDGRKEGRTDGKKDGQKEGRTDGRKDGQTDRRTEGWTDRRKEGRTDGRKDGRKEGRTEGRTDGTYCAGVKDLASAYVLCPRLTEQCVSFYLEGSGSRKGLRKGSRR